MASDIENIRHFSDSRLKGLCLPSLLLFVVSANAGLKGETPKGGLPDLPKSSTTVASV